MTFHFAVRRVVPLAMIAVLVAGCGDAESGPGSVSEATGATKTVSPESGSKDTDETAATESVGDAGDTTQATQQPDSADRQEDESAASSIEQEEYDYPDEPEPAAGVVATLCNLDPGYLGSLRNENSSGEPIVDDDLRLSVLALGDQISYWETLRDDYPAAASDIDSAGELRELWGQALLSHDSGDASAAGRSMLEADQVIDGLSGGARPDSAECVG
ncbi:MAG: hypothetical protein WBG36_12035 [Ornithinimicrobium sp.]